MLLKKATTQATFTPRLATQTDAGCYCGSQRQLMIKPGRSKPGYWVYKRSLRKTARGSFVSV